MNEQLLQQSELFKEYVQKLSPPELEPKKKVILTCNEEKQRALYDGDRKYCFSPFCPLCEARRQVLDVIGLINAGDYLKTMNDFEFCEGNMTNCHADIFLFKIACDYAGIYAKHKEGQFRGKQSLTLDLTMF